METKGKNTKPHLRFYERRQENRFRVLDLRNGIPFPSNALSFYGMDIRKQISWPSVSTNGNKFDEMRVSFWKRTQETLIVTLFS